MSTDIDNLMSQFRLASRELFNHFFRVPDPYENDGWIMEERFSSLQSLLFKKLVTEAASLSDIEYGYAQPEIIVSLRGERAPVLLNRETDSGYWDHPIQEMTSDAQLFFVSFFDWDQLEYHDNRYVRVQIGDWPSHPDATGKHVLIEWQNVRFADPA